MSAFNDAHGFATFKDRAAPLEKCIIATLLDSPDLAPDVAEFVEVGDFFTDAARQVYAWISSECKSGQPVSSVLALSRFAGTGYVEEFVMDTMGELPEPASVLRAAEELRDIATRRDVVLSAQSVVVEAFKFEDSTSAVLSRLSLGVQAANQRLTSNGETIKSYGEVGDEWLVDWQELVSGKALPGVATGYHQIDELLAGLQPADLVIIGGRPSMGKTTFAMNIIEYVSLVLNEPTMVFSLEMPMKSIYQRSLASVGGIPFEDLRRGKLKTGDLAKLKIGHEKLKSAPIFIDDTAALSLEQLATRAIRQFKKKPFKLMLIDYLQLMRLSAIYAGNPNQGIGEISRGLKQLAKLLGIPIIVLSQLSRDLERRPNKRPMPADLRDSGSIEQDADVIGFVYRDEVYNQDTELKGIAEFIIAKQRNGPLGTAYLGFVSGQSSFVNLSANEMIRVYEKLNASPKGKGSRKHPKRAPEPAASSFADVGEALGFLGNLESTPQWNDGDRSESSDPYGDENPL